jgi:hypothetical protein
MSAFGGKADGTDTPSNLSKPPPETVHQQGRTPPRVRLMSALPPKADIAERDRHVDAVGRKVRRTTALGQAVSCASFA